ncbi:efflux RND transporter periplasmic adaptor subunit [Candidatus Peregrinibacteria bacterium]|nr:efflux RND transporter periplasmic adaptor subunit [Candidatus Peregrinibacteria bacterium]
MKTTPFYKKKKWYVLLGILLAGAGLYAYFSQEAAVTYETIAAERGELVQEVSVTGRVKAVESADLAFETSGRVAEIFVEIGEDVEAGQALISLNNADLEALKRQAQAGVSSAQASLQQYQAALETQQVKLEELKRGTRPEEIRLAETALYNAEKNLEDANINLKNVETSADATLEEVYSSALNVLPTAVNAGKGALLTLTDIQYAHFTGSSTEELHLANVKKIAVDALLGAYEAGRWTTKAISVLNGGVYGDVQNVMLNPTHETIDTVLTNSLDALLKVKNALDAVPVATQLTATEKTSLDTEKKAIDLQISTISGKRQTIMVQKTTNSSSIASAEAAINNAKNALATAQDQLDLKRAGYTQDQINAQEAQVKQAQAMVNAQRAAISQAWASVQNYQAQIDKTILKAPISGTVSRLEVKVGEIVFPSSSTYEIQVPAVSLISEGDYEIEVSIPEVDVTKVKIGDKAKVTLDAYGSEDVFLAEVATIDPAETLVEGLATYKTTLIFIEADERVKSGMTANVDIVTASKEDVIIIPQRLVITKDGKKIVRVLKEKKDPDKSEKTIEEVVDAEVVTGLRGSKGEIEITEGINEGDRLVTAIHNGE